MIVYIFTDNIVSSFFSEQTEHFTVASMDNLMADISLSTQGGGGGGGLDLYNGIAVSESKPQC